ncbi:hypothetical protein FG05_30636 [Fusarium graminearum]|nr:hypothetical protein FG05_30636 [Fusarium graminearum]
MFRISFASNQVEPGRISSRASWLHACVALQLVLPTAKIYTRVKDTKIFFALTNRCVSQLVPYRFFHGIAGDILILSTEKTNSAGTEPGDPWMDQTYSDLARVLVGTASGSCAI